MRNIPLYLSFLIALTVSSPNPQTQTFQTGFTVSAQSFVVTNTDDHGPGSLREAITNANATPGMDTIIFNIPGAGVKIISLLTPLPEITDPVIVGADTQPGYAGAPLIELDGVNAGSGANGLIITAGGTIVRSLAIGRFQAAGIVLRSCDSNSIQGNYIGIDANGTLARPNNIGIQLSNSSNNLIGGTVAAMRNVISGNDTGIEISGANNIVEGNFIGTNATGTSAIGNAERGVAISGPSSMNNFIGGDSAGAGNLISGNGHGIFIQTPSNTVQGNLIGTDVPGTHKIGNSIGIEAQTPSTLIGGLTPAARNVISGNGTGVIFGEPSSKLQGNFIGTDITGTVALGNTFDGVVVGNAALIGGSVPEARNVISGNGESNISMGSWFIDGIFVHFTTVEGNYIGTDVTGNRALTGPDLSPTHSGIFIYGSFHLVRGNVISGNVTGVQLAVRNFSTGLPSRNIIQGNLIGLNAPGTAPLPNAFDGINLQTAGSDNAINQNKIAFNGRTGITISGVTIFGGIPSGGIRNSIRSNSIFSNGGLGIDLGSNGVTPNDPTDADVGENNLQNFPVITSMQSAGNSTTIQGSLNSTPNTTFQIDFFSSAALDPSGYGEGALFIGTAPVTTDGNGVSSINVTFQAGLGTGRVVTATATDPNGNTSEFSAGDATSAAGNLQFSVDSIRVIEDVGLATITVLRNGGSTGTLTVDYATTDGAATAGQDYTATSGTLTFNGGETSKSFQVPINNDVFTEPDETFTVALSNATSLDALGTPHTAVVTIADDDELQLLLEQSGPTVKQAAALDALLFLRDTFPVAGVPEWFPTGSDRNTRVMFFVRGLQLNPGESPSTVIVRLVASNGLRFEVPAEDVRPVRDVAFTQLVIRLPESLSADIYTVTVSARSRTSNAGTIRIAP